MLHFARFDGPPERVGVFWMVHNNKQGIHGPTRRGNGSQDVLLEQLNGNYQGLIFLKDFKQFGMFTGTVNEAWHRDDGTYFAHAVYEDGDQ